MNEETRFAIVGGPSELDFVATLFNNDETVRFIVKLPGTRGNVVCTFVVNDSYPEDGSRKRWFINGLCVKLGISTKYQGYYNTSTRTGWLKNALARTQKRR